MHTPPTPALYPLASLLLLSHWGNHLLLRLLSRLRLTPISLLQPRHASFAHLRVSAEKALEGIGGNDGGEASLGLVLAVCGADEEVKGLCGREVGE